MGFQGTLASVNLGDIMQTLAVNRQTGTLVVKHAGTDRYIWFENGEIAMSDGASKDGSALVLTVLQRRSMLTPKQATELSERLYSTGQPLRDIIMASGLMPEQDLDDVCASTLEDKVCEIFEWEDGEFNFVDGPPVPALAVVEVIEAGGVRLQTQSVVMEAMRRRDEWGRINEIIPDKHELYVVDNDGRNNLQAIDTGEDPDMVKVLRYLDGKHSINRTADLVGIPHFDAFAIVSQLVMAGVARPCAPQEVLDDALALREAGEVEQAAVMLENAASRIDVPEVIRPLAEIKLELGDTPRAVELYLDLIQRAQDDGNFDQALRDLDVVIKINPDDPDIQIDRAEVLLDLDRTADASAGFIAAATNYLATRDTKLAVDACHRARDLDPTSPDPHRLLAKAYLLDNQSENALAEYRSLWHSLLSHNRPKRALDQLTTILDEDCKFQRVKEQVLVHARGSDAVKTGSAVRRLVYLVMLLVLAGSGYAGYQIYETKIALAQRQSDVNLIESKLKTADEDTDYTGLSEQLRTLKAANTDPELATRINTLIELHSAKFEETAAELRTELDTALNESRLDEAEQLATTLVGNFRKAKASAEVGKVLDEITNQRARESVQDQLAEIGALWAGYRWDESVAKLSTLTENTALTPAVRAELVTERAARSDDLNSAEFLFRKGEELERSDRATDARRVYERAMAAKGDFYRDEARKKLVALEDAIAAEKKSNISTAIKQEDSDQIFALLDDLRLLAEKAHGTRPAKEYESILLPLALTLDHPTVAVTINDGQREQTVIAPTDATGPWRVDLTYPATGGLTVTARRSGFHDQELHITAGDRRTTAALVMQRGHLWQTDLRSAPVTTPQIGGSYILVCTADSKLHFVSRENGGASPQPYDPVHSFTQPPFIHQNTAYVALGGQIHATDTATRSRLWAWPDQADIDSPSLGRFGLWVQEHELIPGQHQLFAGAQPPGGLESGTVVTMAIDQRTLELEPYPDTPLSWAVTGPPLVFGSVLYIPAGRHIVAFDGTSASRRQPLTKLYEYRMRSEVELRPVSAEVAKTPAILITDASGTVIAIDADPYAPSETRTLMSWNLAAPAAASPVVDPNGRTAYVSQTEIGGVTALVLDRPQERSVRWRFPSEGQIGSIPGPPAVGKNGIYVADANGILYCIDRETGKERWKADLQSGVVTGVAAADGRIYVGTRNGMLMCFEEGD
jgi:tetratricopeptide (TPR) repeat protein